MGGKVWMWMAEVNVWVWGGGWDGACVSGVAGGEVSLGV